MRKSQDVTGQQFGHLTAIAYVRSDDGAIWRFRCDCGNEVERKIGAVRWSAKTGTAEYISCGCQHNFTKHGLSSHRLNSVWRDMKKRCYNIASKSYPDYGGRGIVLCDEWQEHFAAFYNWAVANGYEDDLTIERKNHDGPYSPANCTWIPRAEQNRNTRASRWITHNGVTKLLADWARDTEIQSPTIIFRLQKGWSIDDALTIKPVVGRNTKP